MRGCQQDLSSSINAMLQLSTQRDLTDEERRFPSRINLLDPHLLGGRRCASSW